MAEMIDRRLNLREILNGDQVPLNENLNTTLQTNFLARSPKTWRIQNAAKASLQSKMLVRSPWRQVKHPALILHGTEKPFFPPDHARALKNRLEDPSYYLIERMGHVPNDYFFNLMITQISQHSQKTVEKS